MVRDYRENTSKWTDAKITEKTGPLSYKVTTGEHGNWRRHADQMLSTSYERPRHKESIPDVSVENPIGTDSGSANAQQDDTQPAPRRYPLRDRKPPERLSYS